MQLALVEPSVNTAQRLDELDHDMLRLKHMCTATCDALRVVEARVKAMERGEPRGEVETAEPAAAGAGRVGGRGRGRGRGGRAGGRVGGRAAHQGGPGLDEDAAPGFFETAEEGHRRHPPHDTGPGKKKPVTGKRSRQDDGEAPRARPHLRSASPAGKDGVQTP
jgi:hypothetical protein